MWRDTFNDRQRREQEQMGEAIVLRREHNLVKSIFSHYRRDDDFESFWKSHQEAWGSGRLSLHFFQSAYPDFPITLAIKTFGGVDQWTLADLFDTKKVRHSEMFYEFMMFYEEEAEPSSKAAGIVFRVTGVGRLVIHNWRNREFISPTSGILLTIPVSLQNQVYHFYVEPLASLLTDIGDDWMGYSDPRR